MEKMTSIDLLLTMYHISAEDSLFYHNYLYLFTAESDCKENGTVPAEYFKPKISRLRNKSIHKADESRQKWQLNTRPEMIDNDQLDTCQTIKLN